VPRPKKCRRVGFIPKNMNFKPEIENVDEIVLTVEEVEAIRLSDFEYLEQDDSAQNMEVSRGTYQRILKSARSKVADALVNGKKIKIEGGNYTFNKGQMCYKRCKGRKRMDKY
jgi:predicted DNA-binding protein (UPF0251 family)